MAVSSYENSRENSYVRTRLYKPKIVCLGGGTGLSTMLRGLKKYTSDITAVVSVADDGGGSGVLREDFNMPPPGDIRNCILALSQVEPVMERILNYRFGNGVLEGQSFGNLFLAAMTGTFDGDFVTAVRNVCRVLNITGKVFPVTASDVELVATMENGETVIGESKIGSSVKLHNSPIKKVRLRSKTDELMPIEPLCEIIDEVENADLITLGPGSLYTSVIPNLVIPSLKETILKAKAPVVYINNIMTQPGETDNYTAFDHALAILDHTSDNFIDYCIVNSTPISDELLKKYNDDGADRVRYDLSRFASTNIKLIEKNLAIVDRVGHIRHNTEVLTDALIDIISMSRNKEKCEVSSEGVVLYRPKQHSDKSRR